MKGEKTDTGKVKSALGEGLARLGVSGYVADMQTRFGAYARPASEARRLVDASMGNARLTDILYESRKD